MKLKDIFGYLAEKNKLSLRNVRSGQEIWHVFVSRLGMTFAFLALVFVVFAGTLALVAYTPLVNIIPGFPGSKSREVLMQNIVKLDSLQVEMDNWSRYYTNFSRILDGQLPTAASDEDTLQRQSVKGEIAGRIPLDSVLRAEMTEEGSPYKLEDAEQTRKRTEMSFEMIQPVKGVKTRDFDPRTGMYGVELAPTPNQPILTVLDGTVVLDSWDPRDGNVVMIQHAGNMVSVYKQVSRVMKKTGERVRAGEPIAVTRQMPDNTTPHVVFELWYNGTAVDPENYIVF